MKKIVDISKIQEVNGKWTVVNDMWALHSTPL